MLYTPCFGVRKAAICCVAILLALSTALTAQQPFTPNDPYFNPGTEFGTAEGYHGQWHLWNQMPVVEGVNVGLDINILGAWNAGWTGAGVIIGIVDDGLQGDHPDFTFHNAYSWDFAKTQAENLADAFRGHPVLEDDDHGTNVGGVAAATGGNGVGGTGSAPYAGVAALRYMTGGEYADGKTAAEAEVAAILFQGQLDAGGNPDPFTPHDWSSGVPVRVKNHSYGIPSGYIDIDPTILEAYEESAGHGVLHVLAAGNARATGSGPEATGDANKAEATTSPYVLVVAAMGSDGKFADYSSFGANVVVTAPSLGSLDQFGLVTTDRPAPFGGNAESGDDPYFTDDLNYTSIFDGTSGSAPVVSGVMAAGVQANPDLDVRMARHLLARTSRMVDPDDDSDTGGWVLNAAGYHFNNNYGFGLIDATAFVTAATEVVSMTESIAFEGHNQEVGFEFGEGALMAIGNYTVTVADPLPLEYVAVRLLITGLETDPDAYQGGAGAIAGDFSAYLTSPSGTRNRLFVDDRDVPLDKRSGAFEELEWIYLSLAYFGESLNGDWTLELFNHSANTDYLNFGVWEEWTLYAGMGDLFLIPEPSVGMLLLAGLMIWLRRRNRSAPSPASRRRAADGSGMIWAVKSASESSVNRVQ